MSSRKSNRNIKRQDYSREDFGCKSCDSYECKGCDDKVASESSSSEGSEVERWIATLSDIEDNFQTPAADSGAESSQDQTLTQVDSDTEELPTVMAEAAEVQHLESEAATTADDIDDCLDEYDVTTITRIEDLDGAIRKIELLRLTVELTIG